MDIDPEERADLPRRLFAMAGRRLEKSMIQANDGEATGLTGAAIASLAEDLHECGQDLLVLADAITVIAMDAAHP
jgi:hypothetical protein